MYNKSATISHLMFFFLCFSLKCSALILSTLKNHAYGNFENRRDSFYFAIWRLNFITLRKEIDDKDSVCIEILICKISGDIISIDIKLEFLDIHYKSFSSFFFFFLWKKKLWFFCFAKKNHKPKWCPTSSKRLKTYTALRLRKQFYKKTYFGERQKALSTYPQPN